MLVTLPVTFPLTVLTIKGEYSGSLEADTLENTQVVQVWSEKSFLSVVQNLFGMSFLKQDHKLHLVTLWAATFPTVFTISEEYSGSLEADMSENHPSCSSVKWEVLPLFCLKVSWMQFAGHSHVQVASVYGEGLFETLYKQVLWNIHESPWLMIPTPSALVCPKTYDTVAEDTCNIDSHISIDRTHDKPGILRQARYIQAVLKQTCQRTAGKFSHPSRASHLLVCVPAWHMGQI